MTRCKQWARPIGLAAAATGAAWTLRWALTSAIPETYEVVTAEQQTAGDWTLDQLVVGMAAAACALVAFLVLSSALLTVLSALIGSAAPQLDSLARAVTPQRWRRFILLSCGLGISVPAAAIATAPTHYFEGERCEPSRPTSVVGLALPDLVAGRGPTAAARPRHIGHGDELRTIAVHPGDSLWQLSSRQLGAGASDADVAAFVARMLKVNLSSIEDPDLIYPGQILDLPGGSP